MPSRRADSLGNTSRVALSLVAISMCIDFLVVWAASAAEVRRCDDGYTNLLRVFWQNTLLVAAGAAVLLGHDLLIRSDYPQERLALRYLLPALLLAPVAVACIWIVLHRAPEMPCFD